MSPQKSLDKNIHGNVIHYNQEVEAVQMSITDEWMEKMPPQETQDEKAQDTGTRELRCIITEPRLLHLPIHRKVLNSLT